METEPTVSAIVAEVAAALKDAAAEYGPQAADLALLAYRVDAIKGLLLVPVAGAAIYGIWRGWRWLWKISEAWVDNPGTPREDTGARVIARTVGTIVGGIGAFVFALVGLSRLLDIPLWIAAFGKPELLIATRALEAAGLL